MNSPTVQVIYGATAATHATECCLRRRKLINFRFWAESGMNCCPELWKIHSMVLGYMYHVFSKEKNLNLTALL